MRLPLCSGQEGSFGVAECFSDVMRIWSGKFQRAVYYDHVALAVNRALCSTISAPHQFFPKFEDGGEAAAK
jgi:hypothetical protein